MRSGGPGSLSRRRRDRHPERETTASGRPRGFDAGRKIKGRKRHVITNTQGLLVGAVVHAADLQDRDGAPDVLATIRNSFPWLRHVIADGGYAGDLKISRKLPSIGGYCTCHRNSRLSP
ncbi:MAG: transposase [Sphingomonadales bacterium]|nr:transposase [Sphingomonadales bacterium]